MAKVSWEEAEEKAKNAGGGTFVRLKNDKDKVVGVFVGDPDARETIWVNNRSVPFTEEHAKKGESPALKVKFNFALFKQGNGENVIALEKPQMKVFEVNAKTFNAIAKARKKYGLEKCMFEVERNGVANDNKTTYSVLPDEDLTDAHRAMIAELKLHKLETAEDDEEDMETYGKDGDKAAEGGKTDGKKADKPKPDTKAATKPAVTPAADAGPISPEDAQALVARLKPLDREAINKFLGKFGVAKIKDVLKKDLDAAKAFVTELEPKPETEPDAGAEENDPFA